MGEEVQAVLEAIAHPANQAILSLLAVEPAYTRRIASQLDMPETAVSRRVRQLEDAGLIQGDWVNIGKNVKMYELKVHRIELTLEPGRPSLQLSAPDGDAHRIRPSQAPAAIPEPSGFHGREAELSVLSGQDPVVLIEGLPGIGKTSLMARYAEEIAGERSVLWHRFTGPETPRWFVHRVAGFLAHEGHPELEETLGHGADDADLPALIERAVDDAGIALLLDDLHLVEDEVLARLLKGIMASLSQGKLVATTRELTRGLAHEKGVRVLELAGLDDEAVAGICADQGFELSSSQRVRLREEVGGHPLALILFLETARSQGVSVDALLDRVPEADLEAYLLEEVVEGLEEDERQVLAAASLFRTPFTAEDLSVITERNPRGALVRLRKRLLIESVGGAFLLHEVVRNFFATLVHDRQDHHEALARHHLAQGTLEGHLEALHHYREAGRFDQVSTLLTDDLDLEELDRLDPRHAKLYLATLEEVEREEVDDKRWALVQDEKGDIRFHRGELERALACWQEAEALFEELGEPDRVADLCWKQALALHRSTDLDGARETCQRGLNVAEQGTREHGRLEKLVTFLEP